ncbi:MAG: hypothetical protein CL666_03220 [Balneola sp.]|nr:hypothetical protein [Balneola sp.]|tara:strand:+ start:32005 stop:32370 length:366 start_codon:yes stop_codon:yes gene_type:complete
MEWSTVIFLGMGMFSLVMLITVIIFGTRKSSEMKALENMLAEKTKLLNSDTNALRKALIKSEEEKEQILHRLQNLEAIVTSEAWEFKKGGDDQRIQLDLHDDELQEMSDSDKAAKMAKQVR